MAYPSYLWSAYGLFPISEHRFHETRQWRFDFAWVDRRIAVEIDGGVWIQGRHTTGSGFEKDMEKFNEAGRLGWRIFRFTPKQIRNGEAQMFMKSVIKGAWS